MKTLAERAEMALRLVREAPVIAFDTETSGLDWRKHSVVGYVITAGRDANAYIPVRHGGGGNLGDPNCCPMVDPETYSPKHLFEVELANAFIERRANRYLTVMHNAKFDIHMAANHGIFIGRMVEDTQINESLLNEFARSYSLDACATGRGVTAKLGKEMYEHLAKAFGGEADQKQMGNFWRLPGNDPVATDYAMGDGVTTLELREAQLKKIREPVDDHGNTLEYIHAIESALIWTVYRMERRGIKIDLNRIDEIKDQVKQRLEAAKARLPVGFNVRSAPQVKKLIEEAGHVGWPVTEKGNASFTEKWLKTIPEGQAIIDVRRLSNLENSFINPLVETHMHKGRVHSSLNQMKADEYGTISGRFSSSHPNLQQVPKRNKDLGGLFRSIFIPDDGMEFFEADYSQCEPRLFAHYSKDQSLLDGYNQTPFKDMHAVVAEFMGVERDPTAKRMNMGLLTTMQPRTFAAHMSWPLDKATDAFNQWMKLFPGIAGFQQTAKNVFRSRGFVRTLLGRVCRLDDARYAYRAVSRIIQGGNADIVKKKLLDVDQWLEESYKDHTVDLLMTIHDSFEGQNIKDERGRHIRDVIVKMFEDVQSEPFNLRVPFVVEVGVGPNWQIATYGEGKTNE